MSHVQTHHGETHGVPFTVDAEGFVVVDGERVRTPAGKLLRPRSTYEATCQRCCRSHVTVPLHLVRDDTRGEYWFASAWSFRELCQARCADCAKAVAS